MSDVTPAAPQPETIAVRSRRVACDGVGGALGHPRVFMEMGDENFVECGYCDRKFVLVQDLPEDEHAAPGVYEAPAAIEACGNRLPTDSVEPFSISGL